jgi:hypothetical protein
MPRSADQLAASAPAEISLYLQHLERMDAQEEEGRRRSLWTTTL